MPSHMPHGRLAPDPEPGSQSFSITERNLAAHRARLARLKALERALPVEILDTQVRVREAEMRLGLPPSYDAPAHDA